MAKLSLLERPLYEMSQVDDLAGLLPGTALRWLDGYERNGTTYEPIIRPAPTGVQLATWGEFVEVYLMAAYRAKGVKVIRMRPAIEAMRKKFGVAYPLATERPLTDGKELLYAIQEEAGLSGEERFVVVARHGQIVLRPIIEQFLERVEFQRDIAQRLHPVGRSTPVVIDPSHSFGQPVVRTLGGEIRSVRTEVLFEEFNAGDTIDSLSASYELDSAVIEAAIRFETSRPRAARRAA